MADDLQLLREYAATQSGEAFETLVSRYVNLVYSAAMRQVRDPHLAEEVTQAVFILLARKAGSLISRPVLSGWLYRTACYVSADALKTQRRRQQREQEAHMQSTLQQTTPDPAWELISPFLDEALMRLGETDRQAVVLHYFEKRSFADIGTSLGMSQDTARKRTSRALEKLRDYLAKRGIASTTAIIALGMSAHSVQAAPAVLAKSVAAIAIAKGATASGSTLALIKGALKLMAWANAKTALAAGAMVLAIGGATTIVVTNAATHEVDDQYEQILAHPDGSSGPRLEAAPPTLIVRPTRYPNRGGGIWTTSGKAVYVNGDVPDLLGIAYGTGQPRMILPEAMPAGSYDYLNTLPNHQNEALREELKKQFKLVAHRETRQTDVLLLKVTNPEWLNASLAKGGQPLNYINSDEKYQIFNFKNEQCSRIASQFEGYFEKPILDRTGITLRYNWTFRWENGGPETLRQRMERIRTTLLPQLARAGFELVPSREPVEMVIVEHVK